MSIETKAQRLLDEGRVQPHPSDPDGTRRVRVIGDVGEYEVKLFATGKPKCTCEAGKYDRDCSHALAAKRAVYGD